MFGVVEYNDDGLPKCEICNKHFKRILCHVRQVHNISANEYKTLFGLDKVKGICSKESSQLSRQKTIDKYSICIAKNLLPTCTIVGFQKGYKGRTKEDVSEQTRLRLVQRAKSEEFKHIRSIGGSNTVKRKVFYSYVSKNAKEIYNQCAAVLKQDYDTCHDIANSAIEIALTKYRNWNQSYKITTFIVGIAKNLLHRIHDKRYIFTEIDFDIYDEPSNSEDSRIILLRKATKVLTKRELEIYELHISGLKNRQIVEE